jgi:hypothetical protein
MAAHLLAITERAADLKLAQFIVARTGLRYSSTRSVRDIQNVLIDYPQTIVLWDAEDERNASITAKLLYGRVPPSRVFAITDAAINQYSHLFDLQIFGHHLQRRFMDPAPDIYARMAVAALTPAPFGISRFFPKGTQIQKITLRRSSHKNKAVEALNNFLVKKGVISRLAQLAAQASDEFLMNAIFDAPVGKDGQPTRRAIDRSAEFDFEPEPGIDMEIASCDAYTAICVADTYGSFRREKLFSLLKKDYQERAYVVRSDEVGAGLGIHGLLQAGLSILFVCKGGARTEATAFFPNSPTYKEFRAGPRFLSTLMD